MRGWRDWCTWVAGWVLLVESPMWVAVALDAWEERTEPTLEPMPVPAWVPWVSYVAAVMVPLALVLLLVGLRRPVVRRAALLVGAVGLAAGAVAFSGFPGSTVGPFYVGLTALAAGASAAGALLPAEQVQPDATAYRAAGLGLVAAGIFAAWTCWQGGAYWQWDGASALRYEVGLVVSAGLVALGLTASRWRSVRSRVLRWTLLVLGVVGALYVVAGAALFRDYAVLYRFEETEPAWGLATLLLLGGTGLLAAAVGAWRRRGDLVAWSLAAGTTFALLALWRETTWGSVVG